jgi:hypothetical protein
MRTPRKSITCARFVSLDALLATIQGMPVERRIRGIPCAAALQNPHFLNTYA